MKNLKTNHRRVDRTAVHEQHLPLPWALSLQVPRRKCIARLPQRGVETWLLPAVHLGALVEVRRERHSALLAVALVPHREGETPATFGDDYERWEAGAVGAHSRDQVVRLCAISYARNTNSGSVASASASAVTGVV